MGHPPDDLSRIVGIFRNPDRVTSENFHEHLYGDRGDERTFDRHFAQMGFTALPE